MGGNRASNGTEAFSKGMDWINFSPPTSIIASSSGRRQRASGRDSNGCSYEMLTKLGDKIVVCAGILLVIFLLRSLACYLYMRQYPDQAKPPDLSFPNWEGPVLIIQLFGICDVCIQMIMSGGCAAFSVLGAMLVCLPLGFLIFGFAKCYRLVREKNFTFSDFPKIGPRQAYKQASQVRAKTVLKCS